LKVVKGIVTAESLVTYLQSKGGETLFNWQFASFNKLP